MSGETKKLVAFDFSKESDVIRCFELSGAHAANETLPMPNIVGMQRAAHGPLRLAELKLRYDIHREKAKKAGGTGVSIPLLEQHASAV